MFAELPWDSEFFGIRIARVTESKLTGKVVMALLEKAREHNIRCLYFEAEPNDPVTVAAVEQHGFHLVDVRIVLEYPFDDRPGPTPRYPVPPELVIGAPRDDELARLQDIAAQISYTSRFTFDKKFTPDQSECLYRHWIEKSSQGFADAVLIARWREAGEAVGLITCTLRDGVSGIQLAGVHADHRQRGVGTGLVQAALDWSKAQGVQRMEVVTQARNVPAQRLYQQMGFFTRSMTLYYHRWL